MVDQGCDGPGAAAELHIHPGGRLTLKVSACPGAPGGLHARLLLLLLLSRVSRVRLCATPQMAAHQAPPSLGVSRQEHWRGLQLLWSRPCTGRREASAPELPDPRPGGPGAPQKPSWRPHLCFTSIISFHPRGRLKLLPDIQINFPPH